MSEEAFNDKEKQFNDLWDGVTPNGVNRTKSLKFRQYILEHVRQMKKPLTRDNAHKYWMVFSRLWLRTARTSDRDTGVTPRPGGPFWEGTD